MWFVLKTWIRRFLLSLLPLWGRWKMSSVSMQRRHMAADVSIKGLIEGFCLTHCRRHWLRMKKREHLDPRGQRHIWPDWVFWPHPGQQNFSMLHWDTDTQTGSRWCQQLTWQHQTRWTQGHGTFTCVMGGGIYQHCDSTSLQASTESRKSTKGHLLPFRVDSAWVLWCFNLREPSFLA